ncbi:hypothetical protein ABE178_28550 [Priestia megaterium]
MLSRRRVNAIVATATEVIVGMIAGYITGYLTAKAKLSTFIVTLEIFTYIRGMAYVLSTGYPIALSIHYLSPSVPVLYSLLLCLFLLWRPIM